MFAKRKRIVDKIRAVSKCIDRMHDPDYLWDHYVLVGSNTLPHYGLWPAVAAYFGGELLVRTKSIDEARVFRFPLGNLIAVVDCGTWHFFVNEDYEVVPNDEVADLLGLIPECARVM